MIIFSEGTRSVPNTPYNFQCEAGAIALLADTIVTPVTLTYYLSTLTKAEAWYDIPSRYFHLAIHVGDDINLQEFTKMKPKSIAVRRFNLFTTGLLPRLWKMKSSR